MLLVNVVAGDVAKEALKANLLRGRVVDWGKRHTGEHPRSEQRRRLLRLGGVEDAVQNSRLVISVRAHSELLYMRTS